MSDHSNKYLLGIFDDEDDLMRGIHAFRQEKIKYHNVYTPFPVHGLDDVMGMQRSRIPVAGFFFGAVGAILALSFMSWINLESWSLNLGGKPFFGLPAFIPISFEVTILFAGVGMFFTFILSCGLWPGKKNKIMDERITDDKFVISFDLEDDIIAANEARINALLIEKGASEVKTKVFED